MRSIALFCVCSLMVFLSAGCVVREYQQPVAVQDQADAPLVQGPGVEVVTVEPPPVERVYLYDPGYPPGCYLYNGFYWYGGYHYERDVFISRVVNVNVHENRYVNVTENRERGRRIEQTHAAQYARTGGVRTPAKTPQGNHPTVVSHPQPTHPTGTQHTEAPARLTGTGSQQHGPPAVVPKTSGQQTTHQPATPPNQPKDKKPKNEN